MDLDTMTVAELRQLKMKFEQVFGAGTRRFTSNDANSIIFEEFSKGQSVETWIAHSEIVIRDYGLIESEAWPYIGRAIRRAFKDTSWHRWATAIVCQDGMNFEKFKEKLRQSLGSSFVTREALTDMETLECKEDCQDIDTFIAETEAIFTCYCNDTSLWENCPPLVGLLSLKLYPRLRKKLHTEIDKDPKLSIRRAFEIIRNEHKLLLRNKPPKEKPKDNSRTESDDRKYGYRPRGGYRPQQSSSSNDSSQVEPQSNTKEVKSYHKEPHEYVKRDPSKLKCYSCQEMGHKANACPKKEADKKQDSKTQGKPVAKSSSVNVVIGPRCDSLVVASPKESYSKMIEINPEGYFERKEEADTEELARTCCPQKVVHQNPEFARRIFVSLKLDDVNVRALFDPGSERFIIGESLLDRLNESRVSRGLEPKYLVDGKEYLSGATGHSTQLPPKACVLKVEWNQVVTYERSLILPNDDGCVLSIDYIRFMKPQVDWINRTCYPKRARGIYQSQELTPNATAQISSRKSKPTNCLAVKITLPPLTTPLPLYPPEVSYTRIKCETSEVVPPIHTKGVNVLKSEVLPKVQVYETCVNSTEGLEEMICPKLPREEKEKFMQIIQKFEMVFDGEPGRFTGFECCITLKPHEKSLAKRPYPLTPEKQAILNKILERYMADGILRDASGEGIEYASPVLLVPKYSHLDMLHPDQKHRLVCDYREVNLFIENYPTVPPNTRELFSELAKAKYKIVADMSNGFFQIPLARESQKYTSIITQECVYVFERLPQGIKTGPAIFQEVANWICKDIPRSKDGYRRVMPYLDDVIIVGSSLEELREYFEMFLARIALYGMKLNKDKVKIAFEKLKFLGHILTQDEILPDPGKIKAILELEVPRTLSELRSCLGMINYLSHFIEGSAKILQPMYQLTKGCKGKSKNVPITFTREAMAAFETIKKVLTDEKLGRAYFDPDCDLEIHTDASGYAIGGVVLQISPDGSKKILSTHSRLLLKYELHRHITEKECLAILDVVKQNRMFLLACRKQITVKTDHCALCYLHKMKDSNYKLTRWAIALSPFDLKIEHISGLKNLVADHLSRYSLPMPESENSEFECIEIKATRVTDELRSSTASGSVPGLLPHYEESLKQRQQLLRNDDYSILEQEKNPVLRARIEELKMLPEGEQRKGFTLENGLLYKAVFNLGTQSQLLVICIGNERLQRRVFDLVHSTDHPGVDQCYLLLSRRVYWPNMRRIILKWTSECSRCQKAKVDRFRNQLRAHVTNITDRPFTAWSLDYATVSEADRKSGASHFVCAVDQFSRYVVCKPSSSQTADMLLKFLVHEIVLKFGYPRILRSDNGSNFKSDKYRDFARENGIILQYSMPDHSTGNSLAERKIGAVKDRLRAILSEEHSKDWVKYLPLAVFSINTQIDAELDESPFCTAFGSEPRLLIDQALPMLPTTREADRVKYLLRKDKQLKQLESNLLKDRRPVFKVGDKVLVRQKTHQAKCNKLADLYVGPFVILKSWTQGNFTVRSVDGLQQRYLHESKLKHFKEGEKDDSEALELTLEDEEEGNEEEESRTQVENSPEADGGHSTRAEPRRSKRLKRTVAAAIEVVIRSERPALTRLAADSDMVTRETTPDEVSSGQTSVAPCEVPVTTGLKLTQESSPNPLNPQMATKYPEDAPSDHEELEEPRDEAASQSMKDATGVEGWTPGLDNSGIRTVAQRAEAASNLNLEIYSRAARGMFQRMLEASPSVKRTFDHMDSAEKNVQSSSITVTKKFAPAPASPPSSSSSEDTVVEVVHPRQAIAMKKEGAVEKASSSTDATVDQLSSIFAALKTNYQRPNEPKFEATFKFPGFEVTIKPTSSSSPTSAEVKPVATRADGCQEFDRRLEQFRPHLSTYPRVLSLDREELRRWYTQAKPAFDRLAIGVASRPELWAHREPSMWTARTLARANGVWPLHSDYLAVFIYNHYHLLLQENSSSRDVFTSAVFSNVRILATRVTPADGFVELEEASNYYYLFHDTDYETHHVHLQYLLPVELPVQLRSLLERGVYILQPRGHFDQEPVEYPFGTRLEALARVQRAGPTRGGYSNMLGRTALFTLLTSQGTSTFYNDAHNGIWQLKILIIESKALFGGNYCRHRFRVRIIWYSNLWESPRERIFFTFAPYCTYGGRLEDLPWHHHEEAAFAAPHCEAVTREEMEIWFSGLIGSRSVVFRDAPQGDLQPHPELLVPPEIPADEVEVQEMLPEPDEEVPQE